MACVLHSNLAGPNSVHYKLQKESIFIEIQCDYQVVTKTITNVRMKDRSAIVLAIWAVVSVVFANRAVAGTLEVNRKDSRGSHLPSLLSNDKGKQA